MNPNDIIAQQQAALNQLMHSNQLTFFSMLVIWVGSLLIGGFIVYLFYARLRDIADELRKFRIAFEFANSPEKRNPRHDRGRSSVSDDSNPFSKGDDERYLPKK